VLETLRASSRLWARWCAVELLVSLRPEAGGKPFNVVSRRRGIKCDRFCVCFDCLRVERGFCESVSSSNKIRCLRHCCLSKTMGWPKVSLSPVQGQPKSYVSVPFDTKTRSETGLQDTTMSALFNFESLLLVILLLMCTCTYLHAQMPAIMDRNKHMYKLSLPLMTGCLVFSGSLRGLARD
jgi:hypothetical protein